MAFFDSPSAFFDAGLRFDEASVPVIPTPNRPRRMPKFKLELDRKTTAEKVQLGRTHITAMTGNASFPAGTRVPTDAQVLAAVDDLDTKNLAVDTALTAWKQAIQARDAAEVTYDTTLTSRAANCEAVQPNDLTALASTGLPLRSAPVPVGDLPAPTDFRGTVGDMEGEVDLTWDAVRGAGSYIIECREHLDGTTWQQVKVVQQSRHTVGGLTSGKQYAFRVRAVGTGGEGPWSDETVKRAP